MEYTNINDIKDNLRTQGNPYDEKMVSSNYDRLKALNPNNPLFRDEKPYINTLGQQQIKSGYSNLYDLKSETPYSFSE